MKNLKIIFTACLSMMLFIGHAALTKDSVIEIKTSGKCKKCKARIESGLAFEKGVKSATFDVKTKVVTAKYNPNKTSPEKIKIAITKIGYDADEMKADETAYDKLPNCCKKDDDTKH